MTTLVICEKPSQAKNVIAALGSTYGQILPCQGHLLRLETPGEVKPEWKNWNQDILTPPNGLYGHVPDEGSGKPPRLARIKQALKTAKAVIIATDCDREGQGIGQSILHLFNYRGPVKRAMFTAEDAVTLRNAFSAAKSNTEYETLYQAFVARQQADQIYNLTLTRVATTVLRAPGTDGVIGVGRVKTPTLGILCKREKEILAFKSSEYFEIIMEVTGQTGSATLKHAPSDKDRIVDRSVAEIILSAAKAFTGPISVITERKSRRPPQPYDLPALEQRANTLWGWTVKKTDEIAQELYEEFNLTTYPRAEAQYLPETMIPEIPALVRQLNEIQAYSQCAVAEIRTGADGIFCDKKLAGISHFAIIPNVNCPGGFAATAAKLNADQAKLFDLIARRFLAGVAPDYVYDQTTLTANVPTPQRPDTTSATFTTSGARAIHLGWKAIETDIDEEEEAPIPSLQDGDMVRATEATLAAKWTEPPKRYTEAGLIKAMKDAWKFIQDPAERERLKEAKGLGTPATRSAIIEGLKHQRQVHVQNKNLVPTPAGMLIYDVFMEVAPVIVDPGATARMEARLDDILKGTASAQQVISEISRQAAWVTQRITQSTTRVDLAASKKTKAAHAAKTAATGPKSRPATPPRSAQNSSAPKRATQPAKTRTTQPPPANCIFLRVPQSQGFDAHKLGAKLDHQSGRYWIPGSMNRRPFQEKGWL